MRVAAEIVLSKEDRRRLEEWSSKRSAPVRLRERSRIVLLATEGLTNKEIAAELGIDANKVGRWRRRYADAGLAGIEKERPRGGNHGGKDSGEQARLRAKVIEATTRAPPKDATSCGRQATGALRKCDPTFSGKGSVANQSADPARQLLARGGLDDRLADRPQPVPIGNVLKQSLDAFARRRAEPLRRLPAQ